MKLTKAQRLFIKAGEIYEEIAYCKWVRKGTATSDVASRIRQLKKKRKKLLREALEAANNEWWATYEEGEKEGLAKATLGCIYSD